MSPQLFYSKGFVHFASHEWHDALAILCHEEIKSRGTLEAVIKSFISL